MLKSAQCGACRQHLPLGPGLCRFALPPRRIRCAGCGAIMPSTFAYRATWTESLLWKTCFLACIPVFFVSALAGKASLLAATGITIFATLFMGGLGGFLVALVLAFPVQIMLDLARALISVVQPQPEPPSPRPSSSLGSRGTPLG